MCGFSVHDFLLTQEYVVLNLLGKGGFACVYRAQCKSTGLEVAIKMVRDVGNSSYGPFTVGKSRAPDSF